MSALALCSAVAPPADAGVFSVYSDSGGLCSVDDTQPGTIDVYVFHRTPGWEVGVTGSAFRLGAGGGFSGILQSVVFDTSFLVVGDIAEGVMVSYAGCVDGENILVATVTYAVSGTSAACSYIEVLPFTDGGAIEIYNCDFVMEPATASTRLIVNWYTGCGPLGCVTGTRETTWGAVKALYR
jgi:hypothetical protein